MRTAIALLVTLIISFPAAGQHRLVLRDGTVVNGTLGDLDLEGAIVHTGDTATSFGWDEIEMGTGPDQTKLKKYLSEVGEPLFRLRQRLRSGDFIELADPAEILYPRFATRGSGVAESVCFATYLSRAARQERELSLEPLLASLSMRSRPGFVPEARFVRPKSKHSATDSIGLLVDFPPVFFDRDRAIKAVPSVKSRLANWPGGKSTLGARVYAAALAVTARSEDLARHCRSSWKGENAALDWDLILDAQGEILQGFSGKATSALLARKDLMGEPAKMVAIYWLGIGSYNKSPGGKDAVISLLTLPAKYGATCPELAAAGLYHAALGLDQAKESQAAVALRSELLTRFRPTYFAKKLLQETSTPNMRELR